MSAPVRPSPPRPLPGAQLPGVPPPGVQPPVTARSLPWVGAVGAGIAVLLAGAPVSAVVQGTDWPAHAAIAVAAVVATGLLLYRAGAAVVAAGQCLATIGVLTAMFAQDSFVGVVPLPATVREFGALFAGAGQQIDGGIAPVPSTPEILFLVTAAFGLLAVAVHLAAVGANAPAAAGVPLLAVFAVPAALADTLLPWWAMVAAAAGFGVLLVARDGARRQLAGGTAVIACAVGLALAIGAGSGFVGTAGRFDTGSGLGGSGGSIGLSPFTALRGQLNQGEPVELLRVRGLPRATYLRALTLREYVPDAGWKASNPEPGTPLPGPIATVSGTPGETADIDVQNVAFRDYWLPLYGRPLGVSALPGGQWAYDSRNGTAYTARPRQEDGWHQQAELTAPTAEQLRAAGGDAAEATRAGGPGGIYLDVQGVDPRVGELAAQIAASRATAFDRALALQDFFTAPGSAFSYSLQTAPGAGDDALVEFLTIGRTGYCEQYASAMAVMLRTVGVPARVAVGFTGGTETGDYRSISTSDAHAWVEAWFPEIGWTTFDPTPLTDGRAITPPYVLEARAAASSTAGLGPDDAPGVDLGADQAPATEATAPEPSTPAATAPDADAGTGFPLWTLVVPALLLAAALVPAGLRGRARRRRLAAVAAGLPGAATAGWAELLAESTDRGVPARPSDTVRATARQLVREHHLDGEAQHALRHIVGAVESSWYGGSGADSAGGTLVEPVGRVRAGIAAGSALSIKERLLPRSVLTRSAPPPSDMQMPPAVDKGVGVRLG